MNFDLNDYKLIKLQKFSSLEQRESPKFIYTQDLVSWILQVAHGMEYLSRKQVSISCPPIVNYSIQFI